MAASPQDKTARGQREWQGIASTSPSTGGSSWEEEAGGDPTKRAQGSTPSSLGQERGKARAVQAPGGGGGPWGRSHRQVTGWVWETSWVEKPWAQL